MLKPKLNIEDELRMNRRPDEVSKEACIDEQGTDVFKLNINCLTANTI